MTSKETRLTNNDSRNMEISIDNQFNYKHTHVGVLPKTT